jgi:hypothetical protein
VATCSCPTHAQRDWQPAPDVGLCPSYQLLPLTRCSRCKALRSMYMCGIPLGTWHADKHEGCYRIPWVAPRRSGARGKLGNNSKMKPSTSPTVLYRDCTHPPRTHSMLPVTCRGLCVTTLQQQPSMFQRGPNAAFQRAALNSHCQGHHHGELLLMKTPVCRQTPACHATLAMQSPPLAQAATNSSSHVIPKQPSQAHHSCEGESMSTNSTPTSQAEPHRLALRSGVACPPGRFASVR